MFIKIFGRVIQKLEIVRIDMKRYRTEFIKGANLFYFFLFYCMILQPSEAYNFSTSLNSLVTNADVLNFLRR